MSLARCVTVCSLVLTVSACTKGDDDEGLRRILEPCEIAHRSDLVALVDVREWGEPRTGGFGCYDEATLTPVEVEIVYEAEGQLASEVETIFIRGAVERHGSFRDGSLADAQEGEAVLAMERHEGRLLVVPQGYYWRDEDAFRSWGIEQSAGVGESAWEPLPEEALIDTLLNAREQACPHFRMPACIEEYRQQR